LEELVEDAELYLLEKLETFIQPIAANAVHDLCS
jgi:hypothetical protein